MLIYAALFVVALATLAFELTLSRLLSVVTWYHIGFLAISVAMLGMTAGAITVFLLRDTFSGERLVESSRRACLGFAASIPIALWAICYRPFLTSYFERQLSQNLGNSVLIIALISLPFYFSGIVISALLTQYPLPVNRLYASDLIGAATGCIIVLVGLSHLDAPSFALACSFLALAGAFLLRPEAGFQLKPFAAILVLAVAMVGANAHFEFLSPHYIKGKKQTGHNLEIERWNSFSRISVGREKVQVPHLWAAQVAFFADQRLPNRNMQIDGLAGTRVRRFDSIEDIDHLKYDVTNIAYFVRSPKAEGGKSGASAAAVIGVGGGKDVQSALLFEYDRVVGIEINPIFIDLLENEYRDFAGLGDDERVELVVDEARSHLSHTNERFDLIQMSLIDTWAATSAGAFSLSENSLYTIEAWRTFIERLTDDGVFTVSRWFNENNLGETGRMMSLAVATLLELGVENPARHLALVTHERAATLVLSRAPLRRMDLLRLRKASLALEHQIRLAPGMPAKHPLLRGIVAAQSLEALDAISDRSPYNLEPPTDQNPYFFNMLRLENLGLAFSQATRDGVLNGNLMATITLIWLIVILAVLTLLAIVIPLLVHARIEKTRVPLASAFFFCLIGAGFMSLEIAFLQRLTVFLGHPIYALSVLLFSFIASTGMGSLLSERLSIHDRRQLLALAIGTAALILTMHALMNLFIGTLITHAMWVKCLASVVMIWPVGLMLGCYFPTGMSIAAINSESATAWYWALNGIFGVLFSAVAVFVSIYMGISINVYIAVACYLATGWCLLKMSRPVARTG